MQGPGQPQSLVKLHQLISIATEIGKVAVAATDDNNNDATTTTAMSTATTAYDYLLAASPY